MAIGTALAVGLGSAVLGAGASVASSKKNSKAINQATAAQTAANAQNLALQREIYNNNQNALSPYMDMGNVAGQRLSGFLGLGGDQQAAQNGFTDWLRNSDFAFQQQQGNNAINSGYAGSGTVQSGAAMRGIEQYRQGLQSGYRGDYMNALAGQQGIGFGAASALAGVGQNYANNSALINNNNASALANSAVARANNSNALTGALATSASGLLGQLYRPANLLAGTPYA